MAENGNGRHLNKKKRRKRKKKKEGRKNQTVRQLVLSPLYLSTKRKNRREGSSLSRDSLMWSHLSHYSDLPLLLIISISLCWSMENEEKEGKRHEKWKVRRRFGKEINRKENMVGDRWKSIKKISHLNHLSLFCINNQNIDEEKEKAKMNSTRHGSSCFIIMLFVFHSLSFSKQKRARRTLVRFVCLILYIAYNKKKRDKAV